MKYKENRVFDYTLDKDNASIFGSAIAEIEWNVTDNGEVTIEQFINNEYHTPIMDHDMFYNCNLELYDTILVHIKQNEIQQG